MVSTALLRGTKRQVSRSHSRARSSGRHTAPGTQRGEAHQPYSCRVVTNRRPRTLSGQQPGTRGEAERGGRELDVREIGFQRVQPLGGLPRPEDRHGDDLLAEVAQGGGEVADVVGDAVPLGVGPALHHGDAHGAIFPAAGHAANRARGPRWGDATGSTERGIRSSDLPNAASLGSGAGSGRDGDGRSRTGARRRAGAGAR